MSDRAGDREREPGELRGLGRLVVRCEEILFTAILAVLLVAGLVPMLLRILNLPGVTWSGSLSSQLVLWLALFGAGAATRDRRHISIDAVSHLLPARGRLALRAAVELVAAGACGILVPVSIAFVQLEAELTEGAIAFLGLAKSWLPVVIPVGLSLLTLRFLLAAWSDGRAALRPSVQSGDP